MTTFWIDVSEFDWNRKGGDLDWAKIKTQTSPVMIARASYGDPGGVHFPVARFADHQRAAAQAGFTVRGGYHNLAAGDTNRQVDALRAELDKHDCVWAMLDCEPFEKLKAKNAVPSMDDAKRFGARWKAVDDRTLCFYIGRNFWQTNWDGASLGWLQGPLIAPHYLKNNPDGSKPNGSPTDLYSRVGGNTSGFWDPYGTTTPTGLQFTDNGTVTGASHQTDVDAYPGSLAELTAILTGDTVSAKDVITALNSAEGQAALTAWLGSRDGAAAAARAILAFDPGPGPNGNPPGFAVGDQFALASGQKGQTQAPGSALGFLMQAVYPLGVDQIKELRADVDELKAALGIGADKTPAEIAAILKVALGDKAKAVGQALAG